MSRTLYHVHRSDTAYNADRKAELRADLRREDDIEIEEGLADYLIATERTVRVVSSRTFAQDHTGRPIPSPPFYQAHAYITKEMT